MSTSICTQLLDWNFGLIEALPTWINYPCDEIIIFDWGNGKESAKDVVDQFPDPRIKLLQGLDNKMPYNLSIARNTAIRMATGDLIFSIDSDVKIVKPITFKIADDEFMQGNRFTGRSFTEEERISHHTFLGHKFGLYKIALSGSCIFWKKHFNEINGYHELMKDWGYDDYDFYNRLMTMLNLNRVDFPNNALQHIDHSDDLRKQNYKTKDITISNINNERISKKFIWDNKYKQKKTKVKMFYQDTEKEMII
jgi:hypothetical protein